MIYRTSTIKAKARSGSALRDGGGGTNPSPSVPSISAPGGRPPAVEALGGITAWTCASVRSLEPMHSQMTLITHSMAGIECFDRLEVKQTRQKNSRVDFEVHRRENFAFWREKWPTCCFACFYRRMHRLKNRTKAKKST